MKIKIIVSILLSSFLAFGALQAQHQIPLQGDVSVEDDPTTTTVTEGNLNVFGNFVVGTGSVIGTNSISFFGAVSTGNFSFAVGTSATADGNNCIALGEDASAYNNSIAIGRLAGANNYSAAITGCAYATHSLALGGSATGEYSVALGDGSASYSRGSIAIGGCEAGGDYSVSIGNGVYSESFRQITLGSCNDFLSPQSSSTWISTDPLFVIGNGDGNNYSSALVMLKNGDTTLNGHMTAKSYTVTEAAGGIPMGRFARQEQ